MCYVDSSGHVREAHQDVEVDSAVGVPSLRCGDDLPEHLTPPEHRPENRRAHARCLEDLSTIRRLIRTLANLTSWAPERIEARRRALKGEFDGLTGALQPVCGPLFAVLFALKQLAERGGLLQVLGSEHWAKLVLLLILARVAAQGSRLSAVRWAPQHAVAEPLGVKRFDEDDR
jgi:hypothetical protein